MFQRSLNKQAVLRLIEGRFPKTPLAPPILEAWKAYIVDASEEAEHAFQRLIPWTWWEAPKETLFAGYGGIGFIPDEVFSYYLPGCMKRSLFPKEDIDGIGRTLLRLAARGYAFETLSARQTLAVGWFVYYLALRHELAFDGRFSIVRMKIASKTNESAQTREKDALFRALADAEDSWARLATPAVPHKRCEGI